MKNVLFFLGFAFFVIHEIDAMMHHEWLVIPLTVWIPQDYAMTLFVAAHIPLFLVMMVMLPTEFLSKIEKLQTAMATFIVIHGILHSAFMTHEQYEFDSFLSNLWIFGGTLASAIFLIFQTGKGKVSSVPE
ncbi:DUF6713 family protein [Vibrio nigripulchritudo]|uniref:DUF6713 family protein n=1 Tax=Vibrio nigripulchritudo TaxID=28173 RepID=UPI0003B1EBEF|nr:DUF6713 family protein [Vibrio nigripulchritudo]CCN71093.1 conserved hypothetical protein [Vibrio nigripulchritudo SFn118]